jgi:outer membrane protein OmpA-like peptidoglycan-associated protein
VKGHTGLSGDPDANRALSAERARAVAEFFIATYDVDPNRIRALGFGASQPLPRLPDETDRAYGYRLPRVEFALVGERL